MKTYDWDCVWLDELCLDCKYYHNPVKSKKQPECPRGLEPNWRRLG